MTDYTIGTTVFDNWVIREELGSGAFGRVYRIEKSEYDITTQAALKVIRIPQSQSDLRDIQMDGMDERSVTSYFQGMVNTLVQEIEVMSSLKGHPNIVAYENHKVKAHPGTVGWDILIQMELLTPLRDYQLRHPMAEADVRRLAADICSALVFCQKKSLIHRDIKPQNIFVSEAGQFKLGDFGVARALDKTASSLSKQGTEDYMAPEVYRGEKYGVSADIYSLGLVLYRLMNGGRLPFLPPAPQPIGFSDRLNALSDRIAGEKPLEPPCNASPEFAQLILKACAHDPGQRYQTAVELLAALEPGQSSPHFEAGPAGPVDFDTGEDPEDGDTASPFGKQKATGGADDWEEKTTGPFRSDADRSNNIFNEKLFSDIFTHREAASSQTAEPPPQDSIPRPTAPPKPKTKLEKAIIPMKIFIPLIFAEGALCGLFITIGLAGLGLFIAVLLGCTIWYHIIVCIIVAAKRSKEKKRQESAPYHEFVCPNCQQNLRVPRGKGKVLVTCSRCKYRFTEIT